MNITITPIPAMVGASQSNSNYEECPSDILCGALLLIVLIALILVTTALIIGIFRNK